jgi:hypothetical protein
MEPDCADTEAAVRTDLTMSTQDSIFKMLDAISSQMLQNYQTLQVQLTQTAEDVRRIFQDNDTFRQEIRNELDTIRSSTVLAVLSDSPSSAYSDRRRCLTHFSGQ